ncbi:MAG: preprotein translocase subunit SecG [Candidatus Schekmanbacteria bacterium]|nr:preprotein translocase subunit SecG [Candidatus Schekmanbacteria bacterium]
MTTAITIIHVLVCLFLILVILLQAGKGADMGTLFGGGGSQSVFGSGGAAPFLTKMTTGVAIVFMFTSLGLAISSIHPTASSIMDDVVETPAVKIPVAPDEKKVPHSPVQQGTVPKTDAASAKPEMPPPQEAPVPAQPATPTPIPATPAPVEH